MKYIANPIEVDAHEIADVRPSPVSGQAGAFVLRLDNGTTVTADPSMCSRMTPKVGDYWVVQSDGYGPPGYPKIPGKEVG